MTTSVLHHQQVGKGAPVLLLSGGPGFAASYLHGLAERLSAKYRVIVPDQRGTGGSPSADGSGLTLDAYIDDLERLRVACGVERWTVVGHSWGAMLALAYTSRHADRVRSVVLMSIAALDAQVFDTLLPLLLQRLSPFRQGQATALLARMPTAPDPNLVLQDLFILLQPAYFFKEADAERFVHWLSPATMSIPTYNAMAAHVKAIGFDLRGQLEAIKMPVLLLSGKGDIFGDAPLTEVQRLLPQSIIARVPGSVHYPMLEALTATTTEVLHFLAGVHGPDKPAAVPDISGKWKVTVRQHVNGEPVSVHGKFDLEQKDGHVTGTGTLDFTTLGDLVRQVRVVLKEPLHYELSGTLKDEFMEQAYKNVGTDVGQYGHMMVRILDKNHMEGKFQGFGPEHRIVINGTVEYERLS